MDLGVKSTSSVLFSVELQEQLWPSVWFDSEDTLDEALIRLVWFKYDVAVALPSVPTDLLRALMISFLISCYRSSLHDSLQSTVLLEVQFDVLLDVQFEELFEVWFDVAFVVKFEADGHLHVMLDEQFAEWFDPIS
jgi:hypothetical protein